MTTSHRVLTAAFIACLACYPFGCGYETPHPADRELRERFLRARPKFDELASLLRNNPQILAVGRGGAVIRDGAEERVIRTQDWGYSEEPIRHVASLLKDLQIDWGCQHCTNTPSQLMLFVNCYGLTPSTTCKGYIYSLDPLHPELASLDGSPSSFDRYDRAYAALDGNWRLLFEIWPSGPDRCFPRKHPRGGK